MLRELGIAPDDPERRAKISSLPQRAVGREIARQSGEGFLENAPPGFRGELRRGPEGSPYLVVSDGARFVLVDDSPRARLRMGLDVQVVRDTSGRPVLAHELALRRQLDGQERDSWCARGGVALTSDVEAMPLRPLWSDCSSWASTAEQVRS